MLRMLGLAPLLCCAQFTVQNAGAQQSSPFFYPEPAAGTFHVTKNVSYAMVDTTHFAMDVYRPAKSTVLSPALIYYSPYVPPDKPSREVNDQAVKWARIAAANGIVAVIPDLRGEPNTGNATTPARALREDFLRFASYLTQHAREYGIDPNRITLFAASGAVAAALPAVQDPQQTAVKAVVMYYGGAGANINTFRPDIAVLFVRAGLDSRNMNAAIANLTSLALSQNAPVTLLNYQTGHHGFEAVDDNDATRQVIRQTLEFVKTATAPAVQTAIQSAYLDAVVAGHLSSGRYREASQAFSALAEQQARLRPRATAQLAAGIMDADTTREGRQQVMRTLLAIRARNPANLMAQYQVGRMGAVAGIGLTEAKSALETYLRSQPAADEPSFADANMRLGMILEHQADSTAAIAAYRRAVTLAPGHQGATQALRRLVPSEGAASQPQVQQQMQRPPFFYPEPLPGSVQITTDIPFAKADTATLAMDIYRPANSSAPVPAVIFHSRSRQADEWIKSWARVAAANGIVGIIPDLRATNQTSEEIFRQVATFVADHAAQYGVDRERLALFAGSAGVTGAFPAVENPAQTTIKAAVMYYGTANITSFRRDLPVLYVRAGLDHPNMNADIVRLASLAATQNAPVTLLNHHTGRHGFEYLDDNAGTRQTIEQTLDFIKRATTPDYQAALERGHLDAIAAGQLSAGNFHEASLTFARLIERRPTEGLLRFRYAETLLLDKQFGPACREFQQFRQNFAALLQGPRACVLAGTEDSAIAFLQGMPKSWLLSPDGNRLKTDSVFAPLWKRADFQALMRPQ